MDLYDIAVARKLSGGSGGGGGGSSDFSTAEVTVTISNNQLYVPYVYDDENFTLLNAVIRESGTYNIALYKGIAFGSLYDTSAEITVTGDIEADEGDFYITGNGTITIS